MKPGNAIGHYVLAERLDRSSSGQVWLAYRELGAAGRTAVAIKLPYDELDDRMRDGLHDEARLRTQLQHSNIPRVIDMGLHDGRPYYVMDYIAGRSLAELLEHLRDAGTPLRFEVIAHIAREVGHALRYAHGFELDGASRPVLHRDVAPRNVLLSGHGAVYVVGFGVAEAAGIQASSGPAKGTVVYRAPEHALGFPTLKSDGWGLGAILWEMIEGRPFRGEIEPDDLLRAAKQGRHGRLTREGIPDVLRQVTEGLLHADDRERLALDEALRLLEAPELPVQRMALADELQRCFGDAVHRPGRSLPEPAEATPAAPRVLKDHGPFGLDAWRMDPDDEPGLPPPPAFASMEGPAIVEGEPAPALSGEHLAHDLRAPDDDEPADAPVASPPPASDAAEPPMLAVVDLDDSSSVEVPRPTVAVVPEAPPRPPAAAPAPRRWSPVVLVPVLGLAIGGLAWAGWPKDPTPHASATRSSEEPVPAGARPSSPSEPSVPSEPVPAVPSEPVPAVPSEPVPSEPVPAVPSEPVPVVPSEPTEPVPGEPASSEPGGSEATPPDAAGPTEATTAKERAPKPKTAPKAPPHKSASGPPVPLTITLLLYADMELEINGSHFSLGVRKTSAKTTVAPGSVRVRWRRPLGQWKRKTLEVEPGRSYELLLDDRSVVLKKK